MKSAIFKLDRRIFGLLQDGDFQRFTIRMLRDAYAKQLGKAGGGSGELWRYIYDQIVRLKRVGWIRQDEIRRKRDQLYYVLGAPDSVALVLVDGSFQSTQPCTATSPEERSGQPGSPTQLTSAQRLEILAKEIRLDMLCSLGEAERYKQLFTEMPQLRLRVEHDYIEARDRSSRLLGHLRAVEKTLKLLAAA
ncbi:hypothetical protein [Pseudomonas sp. GM17]|uniref:hypothetical protein n=1 Tax=Pseudomonas sp. GM17 TaxID=1144323 RepID=UPI000272725C|nr:hypothetical protein [Pseudomonas sp. GM17]WIE49840.1 hypothetical protein PMI20_029770 [Pseudomonas sp. GM17]